MTSEPFYILLMLVFELTIAGSECNLEFVFFFDWEEVVGVLEVSLSEGSGFVHSME
jgi:hypothetical protein